MSDATRIREAARHLGSRRMDFRAADVADRLGGTVSVAKAAAELGRMVDEGLLAASSGHKGSMKTGSSGYRVARRYWDPNRAGGGGAA